MNDQTVKWPSNKKIISLIFKPVVIYYFVFPINKLKDIVYLNK